MINLYLIEKIRSLSSNFFKAKVSHVSNLPELNRTINKQAMYSLDAINDAIAGKKKICFIYNDIGTDLKLHPRREEPYIVNPYQIVANNGRFYLVGNYHKYDNVGLDSPETAKARVKNRVMHGGHGISDSDIDRRYVETLQNLKIVLPLCDLAVIYDNTTAFRRFAIYKNGKCVIKSNRLPLWYSQIQ